MRAYWYIRVSGRGQVAGDGPDRQRDSIKAFSEAHGIEFAGEFFERAVSGTKDVMDRPKLTEILETYDIQKAQNLTPIGVIIVERLDRLARDLMIQELILREFRVRGIQVFAVDQGAPIDLATNDCDPTRKMIRQIMGAVSEWQKSELVIKLRKARLRVKQKTGQCEGVKPFGDPAFPGEIHTLRVMKNLRESGLTFEVIATMLNEQRMKTRHGREWNRAAVCSVLSNNKRKEQRCEALTLSS